MLQFKSLVATEDINVDKKVLKSAKTKLLIHDFRCSLNFSQQVHKHYTCKPPCSLINDSFDICTISSSSATILV